MVRRWRLHHPPLVRCVVCVCVCPSPLTLTLALTLALALRYYGDSIRRQMRGTLTNIADRNESAMASQRTGGVAMTNMPEDVMVFVLQQLEVTTGW